MKILEAGCGLGGWVLHFNKAGHETTGVELYEQLIVRAKKYDQEIKVIKGDVLKLDYPDNHFDAYISLGVIEHFKEGPHTALNEARRVLKPGGLAFISIPYLNFLRIILVHPLRRIYFFLAGLFGKKKYFWEYRYTKKELISFLQQTGFEINHIDIDDYEKEDRYHHIGLISDFIFLKKKGSTVYKLNSMGKFVLKFARLFSPWLYCSSIIIVARKI